MLPFSSASTLKELTCLYPHFRGGKFKGKLRVVSSLWPVESPTKMWIVLRWASAWLTVYAFAHTSPSCEVALYEENIPPSREGSPLSWTLSQWRVEALNTKAEP